MMTLYFSKQIGTRTFYRKRHASNGYLAFRILEGMEMQGYKFEVAYEKGNVIDLE